MRIKHLPDGILQIEVSKIRDKDIFELESMPTLLKAISLRDMVLGLVRNIHHVIHQDKSDEIKVQQIETILHNINISRETSKP